MNKLEATKAWVREFNAIPQSLVQKAYPDMEGLEILVTERECSYCGSTDWMIDGTDEEEVCCNCGKNEGYSEKWDLPMWGTMWTFGTSLDDEWVKNNLETVRDCGFWVYESDELGILIGINGAGYDFYEAHWIPLYEARGLKWHKEDEAV